MKSLFEEMGGIYRQVGDYFIPNLILPDRDMHRTAGGIVFDAVFNQIIAIFNNTAESTLTFEKK